MLEGRRNGILLVVTPSCTLTSSLIRALERLDQLLGVHVGLVAASGPSPDVRQVIAGMGLGFPWSEDAIFDAWFGGNGVQAPAIVIVRHGAIVATLSVAFVREPDAQLGGFFGVQLP